MNQSNTRRTFFKKCAAIAPLLFVNPFRDFSFPNIDKDIKDPTQCDYCPCGEYIKDHSIIFHDGWYHLFSISGTQGYYHGYNGNEETISWSISKDLINWEMRGHVLHATQRKGAFDQHEIWAPFCYKGPDGFYMFYTGIIHPTRPMEYKKLGSDHPWVYPGHKETQGLAFSKDLTYWDKIADFEKGLGIPGRDSFVIYDESNRRCLLYSTIGNWQVHVSQSKNLTDWKPIGICAEFPKTYSCKSLDSNSAIITSEKQNNSESLTVMKHPLTGQWIMLANNQFILSDNPLNFDGSKACTYDTAFDGKFVDLGFACETIQCNGKWYRSGTMGKRDYWRLGFTEIEWVKDGAFKIVKPSKIVSGS
jgi:hypothetical protein